MDSTTADLIKSLVPAATALIGILLGSQLSLRNSRHTFQLQSTERAQEREREDLKNAQTHFREYYVLEGFESGLTGLMLLREHFVKEHMPGSHHTVDFDLPVTPFLRIYDVIGCKDIAIVAASFRALGQGYLLGIPSESSDTELSLIDGLFIAVFIWV